MRLLALTTRSVYTIFTIWLKRLHGTLMLWFIVARASSPCECCSCCRGFSDQKFSFTWSRFPLSIFADLQVVCCFYVADIINFHMWLESLVSSAQIELQLFLIFCCTLISLSGVCLFASSVPFFSTFFRSMFSLDTGKFVSQGWLWTATKLYPFVAVVSGCCWCFHRFHQSTTTAIKICLLGRKISTFASSHITLPHT